MTKTSRWINLKSGIFEENYYSCSIVSFQPYVLHKNVGPFNFITYSLSGLVGAWIKPQFIANNCPWHFCEINLPFLTDLVSQVEG